MILILNITQIILSVFLVTGVLLQQRGGGLSPVFGGAGLYGTRRGVEKTIFIATIIVAILFLATAFLTLILR